MQEVVGIVEANWLAFALALLIGVLVAWWLWGRRAARTRERHRAPDALDEGAAPAKRNQALIDAPSAVTAARLADTGPDIFAGMGEAIAAGVAREVEAAKPPPPAAPPPAPPPPPLPEPAAPPPAIEPDREPGPIPGTPAKAGPKGKAPARPKAALKSKAAAKSKTATKPKAEPKSKVEATPKAGPKPAPKAKAAARPKPEPAKAPAPVAAPVEAAAPPPPPAPEPAAPSGGPDDLAKIKGLGPKLQALLPTLGVTSFAQIASWDDAEIDRIDAQLGVFQGRIRKDNWVEQAKYLAGGDVAGYEAKFGKL